MTSLYVNMFAATAYYAKVCSHLSGNPNSSTNLSLYQVTWKHVFRNASHRFLFVSSCFCLRACGCWFKCKRKNFRCRSLNFPVFSLSCKTVLRLYDYLPTFDSRFAVDLEPALQVVLFLLCLPDSLLWFHVHESSATRVGYMSTSDVCVCTCVTSQKLTHSMRSEF